MPHRPAISLAQQETASYDSLQLLAAHLTPALESMRKTLLLLTLCATPLAAQTPSSGTTPSDTRSWWVSGGLSGVSSPYGLGTTVSVHTQRGRRGFRVSYDRAANIKETLTLNAVSVSIGGHTQRGRLHLAGFVGPAVVWGADGLDDAGFAVGDEEYQTFGAAVDAVALLGLGSRVRIGVGIWANVNPQQNAFGIGPRLQVRLR